MQYFSFLFKVLTIFKQLHTTRQKLFKGDESNLAKARAKINEEFKNHKSVKEGEIPELIDVAKQVEHFYRTQVVQAVPVEEGKHSMIFVDDLFHREYQISNRR